jgi:CHAT domain-containing protein/tetratricopeptide (TPR) repeat protein
VTFEMRPMRLAIPLCLLCFAANPAANIAQTRGSSTPLPLEPLRQALERQDASGLREPLRFLATNHSFISHPDEALDLLREALALAHQAQDGAVEALALNATGQIQYDIGRNDEALRTLRAALQLAQTLPERNEEAAVRITFCALYGFTGHPEQALQMLAPTRTLPADPTLHANALTRRAEVFSATGKLKEALADTEEALAIERANGLAALTIDTLIVQGEVYNGGGEPAKALLPLNEALTLSRSLVDRRDEGRTINFLGESAWASSDPKKAFDLWNQALSVEREVGDRPDEATTLHDIGAFYWSTGAPHKAIDSYNEARVIQRAVLDMPDEAVTLNDLGNAYENLGEPQKAMASFVEALPIERSAGDVANEAITLHSMGSLYQNIAQPAKAMELYEQALVLERKVGNRRAEAITLSNIASVYQDLGKPQRSLQLFIQALAAQRKAEDHGHEALTLHDIGTIYLERGQQPRARVYLQQALALELKDDDHHAEAITRWRLAQLGVQSLTGYLIAMNLAQTVGDLDLTGRIQSSLMYYYRDHGSIATAIFFGKEAVNNFQQIRGNLKDLGETLQDAFVESHGDTYRDLARLLFREDRFPEAEQVVNLLKKQEYAEFMRGEGGAGGTAPLPMMPAEDIASSVTAQEIVWLSLKSLRNTRTPEQQAQYSALEAKLGAVNRSFSENIRGVLAAGVTQKNVLAETSGLQNILRQLGTRSPDTIGVYTLVSEKELDLIVVTGNLRLPPRKIAIARDDLTAKVREMRYRLQDRCSDPRPAAQAMYKLLIAPILSDLKGTQAKTIVWELDGALRYIPMSALYDGTHYLAETYRSVLFGASNQSGLIAESIGNNWSGLGFGSSEDHGDSQALPAVTAELEGIFSDKTQPASDGPIPGHIHLNADFTQTTVANELDIGYPIVHIASHFVLKPGSDQSYLVLGAEEPGHPGSGRLTYSELRDGPSYHFDSVQLLTLSACQTGTSPAAHPQDGAEVDALGDLAAARGAKAVMATLWSVNDSSTGKFMIDFYKDWTTGNSTPKAEALRQAQVNMLRNGGDDPDSVCHATLKHPFFWAPFILIGNWQ